MIEKAYHIAADSASGPGAQIRRTLYYVILFVLPIILADLEMDKETIAAGILHDVVEDTIMSLDELKAEFGEEVALLVDGVTKLTQISWSMDKMEIQAEI